MKMRIYTTIFLLLTIVALRAQSFEAIRDFDGIWIAKEFYQSFDSTRNIVASKDAFEMSHPVALRINHKEVFSDKLNIGFSVLHDHLLHPEVSQFEIINGDTIWEQDHFTIQLKDFEIGQGIPVSEMYSFGYLCESFVTFEASDIITIRRANCERERDEPEEIEYMRYTSEFEAGNQFPNPLYNFTRSLTVAGNYTVFDSANVVVSEKLEIRNNGMITGMPAFEGKTLYYSTDIYCGPSADHVYVFMCENSTEPFECSKGYFMLRDSNGDLMWYATSWSEPEPFKSPRSLLGELKYKLMKN